MAKDLYEGKITEGDIDPEMTGLVARHLMKAVKEGYGKDFTDLAYDTPDYEMLSNLEKNVYAFSAAKNWQELKSMTIALKDDIGKIRTFKEFIGIAAQIDKEFNVNWMQTEYNTAIGSGQMAGRWVEYSKNKKIMSLLQYETAGDARVRPEHKKLDGVTKDMDDPFWDSYYPPNGWGCRCDVIQLANGKETQADEIEYPEVPAMWRVNLAKKGLAYPEGHAYYRGFTDDNIEEAETVRIANSREFTRSWAKNNLGTYGKVYKTATVVSDTLLLKYQDVKHCTAKPHKYAADIYRMVENIPDLLAKSEYMISGNDNGKHPEVKLWHYFKFEFKKEFSYINMKETNKGEFRLHSIGDTFDINKVINPQKKNRR